MKPILALFVLAASAALGAGGAPQPTEVDATLRLELFVNDLVTSVAFYQEVLGFSVARRENDYAVIALGHVQIGLGLADGLSKKHHFNPELQTQRAGLGAEIVIEVSEIFTAYDLVKEKGWPLLAGMKKQPWGLSDFRIADPDGYYIRFTSRQ